MVYTTHPKANIARLCFCLGYIKYFDAHFSNFTGGVEKIENCVCLPEEDHGILWKHQDWRTGLAEVRSRRFTVSFICTVANYEYGFFWHFYQDGKIEAEVKLTGILRLGALQPGEARKYGTTTAPVHQHFFVARMDMAVDCRPGEAHNQVWFLRLSDPCLYPQVFLYLMRETFLDKYLCKLPVDLSNSFIFEISGGCYRHCSGVLKFTLSSATLQYHLYPWV